MDIKSLCEAVEKYEAINGKCLDYCAMNNETFLALRSELYEIETMFTNPPEYSTIGGVKIKIDDAISYGTVLFVCDNPIEHYAKTVFECL